MAGQTAKLRSQRVTGFPLPLAARRCFGFRHSLIVMCIVAIAFAPPAYTQEDFYHPELEWKTIESEHFFVHYHEGAERTARAVSKIAEEIFEPITSLYQHAPDQKVSFIIRDHDDISNGAAYFYDNKIELYAPSMDFDFRGTHNWLRNVVTHEFTHIVQIQTSMKFGRRVPSIYLQWLGYESERRPDVLYGYPNIIMSYPLSGFVVPAWFAEGVAQFNRKELRYDFWDTHRDMILRSYALSGTMLSWQEMGVFGKNSLGNESSYNAGFAFVSYIARTYGDEKLNEISRNLSTLTRVSIDGAIERALGKDGEEVYNEWRGQLLHEYATRVEPIRADLHEGRPLVFVEDVSGGSSIYHENEIVLDHPSERAVAPERPQQYDAVETGFANLYPRFSPDASKLAYVSTKNADYFSQSALYVIEFGRPNREKRIKTGVRTGMSWSPDGSKLYYARSGRENPHWSYQFDLYSYDLKTEQENRLTHGRRAITPAVSPDGTTIACAVSADGTSNIALMDIDGSNFRIITPYRTGEQVYNPMWSPDGSRILFDYSVKDGRDIAWIRPDGSELQFLITGPDDSRTGVFTPDGSHILFSSDRTGIFNLYSYDVKSGAVEQVSNVLGGAFMPAVKANGGIIYAAYTSTGYKLYELDGPTPLTGHAAYVVSYDSSSGAFASAIGSSAPQFDWVKLRQYDDTQLSPRDPRPYKSIFTSLGIVPFVRIDNYNPHDKAIDVVKPGVYLFSNDVLDKTGLFAGAALNRKLERDLFFQFFYRDRVPLLYQLGLEPVVSLEAYNVTRKTGSTLSLPNGTVIPVDVTFDLLEFDVAFTHPFLAPNNTLEFRYVHSRYTSLIDDFINPEDNTLQRGISDQYLIGNDLSLTMKLDMIVPSRTSEINPVGRKVNLRLGYEFNKFARSDSNGVRALDTTGGFVRYAYDWLKYPRVELTWKEYVPFLFENHTLIATVHGGTILGPPVDEFFDFYGGGLVGMRGYPFYAIGGNSLVTAGLAYRFPLVSSMDLRFLQFYFDKLYMSVYADLGNAWTDTRPRLSDFKTDAGVELRLESFSFYAYPTRIFFDASYGFNQFNVYVPTRNETVTYGHEWRFYLGVLFGFDFD
jgi:Tol biopolymer transport system component